MFRYLTVALLLAAPAALADEPVALKPGPGLDAVQASCATCHTLGYIRMNSTVPDAGCVEGRGDQDAHRFRRTDRRRHGEHHPQVSDTNYAVPPKS